MGTVIGVSLADSWETAPTQPSKGNFFQYTEYLTSWVYAPKEAADDSVQAE